jgi:hypothetical protein
MILEIECTGIVSSRSDASVFSDLFTMTDSSLDPAVRQATVCRISSHFAPKACSHSENSHERQVATHTTVGRQEIIGEKSWAKNFYSLVCAHEPFRGNV